MPIVHVAASALALALPLAPIQGGASAAPRVAAEARFVPPWVAPGARASVEVRVRGEDGWGVEPVADDPITFGLPTILVPDGPWERVPGAAAADRELVWRLSFRVADEAPGGFRRVAGQVRCTLVGPDGEAEDGEDPDRRPGALALGADLVVLRPDAELRGSDPKIPLRVLYLSEDVQAPRSRAFLELLDAWFMEIAAADHAGFDPAEADAVDVVLLDSLRNDPSGAGGSLVDVRSPLGPRASWTRPTVLLGNAALLLRRWKANGTYG